MPALVHWGADLGDLSPADLESLVTAQVRAVAHNAVDTPFRITLVPALDDGWEGRPGLAGVRDGATLRQRFRGATTQTDVGEAAFLLSDPTAGLSLAIDWRLDEQGMLIIRQTLTNNGRTEVGLARLAVTLPVPPQARERLDFSGRWALERRPQRQRIEHGAWTRETRHGRTGHDSPYLTVVGTSGFDFRTGEVWALHAGWSGDLDVTVDARAEGLTVISAAELLQPAELRLQPGESYASPPIYAAWSAAGLDGISERFHRHVRSRHPLPPRPVILNTWEAVYFEQDPADLIALAERAAAIGVERFVLDDGWMTGRIDDTRALGDWVVDPIRWPEGLHPLIDRVRELGMDFGLWVEPEMISLDSDLARAHPEWVLSHDDLPESWRHQYVLDLGDADAFAHILARLDSLLSEYPIAYLKWDHNRDLLAGSVHRQTLAAYRLIDAVRDRHPEVEIESCASGGGRIDLGVMERTDRVWASDTNDPLERHSIQRFTTLVVPPEWMGSHIGAPTAHTTHRSSDLGFRMATALFASAGIEWNLARVPDADLSAMAEWIAQYKRLRGLLHSGTTVRTDIAEGLQLTGVVAGLRDHALFSVVCTTMPADATTAARLPGLDPESLYRVQVLDIGAPARFVQVHPPAWLPEVTLPGRVLASAGLAIPSLAPAQALLLELHRV